MTFSGFLKTDLVNYPGLIASAVFTRGCNFRCPYCHNPQFIDLNGAGENYSEEEVLSYLEKRRSLLDALVISGGEPTLHTDLHDFIRKVKTLGLKVKLDTNGSRPEVLKTLLDDGLLDYVAMDVKTSPEKYRYVGFSDFTLIEKSMLLLKASEIGYEFRTTCPKGIIEFEDLEKLSLIIGKGPKWFLQPFNPSKTLDPSYADVGSNSAEELNAMIAGLGRENTFVR
ncbi:MAG: anaerobic ribonucleoside-triphosphate reductase activating protein [Sphaerochaeta sp.]